MGIRFLSHCTQIATVALFIVGSPLARAQAVLQFDLPAQSLADALGAVANQTDLNILIDRSLVAGRQAPALKARLSASEALSRLLHGSGIKYQFVDERTVTLHSEAESANATKTHATSTTSTPGGTNGYVHLAQAKILNAEEAEDQATAQSLSESVGKRIELDEIVVTGTHIRGAKDIAQPSFTMTREEIDKAGFNTVENLFEKLPENFNTVTPLGRAAGNLSGDTVASLNWTRVTAIDLRGLGAESTLTLINGRRRAGSVFGRVVDVSAIPLSVIERVDVVTGGASALYGADAVAGVVNIITRRNFNGAESRVSYGGPSGYGGGDLFKASHIWGGEFGRGTLVAAYDYEQRWASDLLDTEHHTDRVLPNGRRYTARFLEADVRRHSGYVAGTLMLGDRAELYGDLFYTDKEVKNQNQNYFALGAELPSLVIDTAPAVSYGAAAGVRIDAGADWSADVGGAHSLTNSRYTQILDSRFADPAQDFASLTNEWRNKAVVTSFSAVADGPLPSILGITPRAALGVEFRKEEFGLGRIIESTFTATGALRNSSVVATDYPGRDVHSAFAELQVPLVEDGGPGLERLELSLGARHDEYSDFGGTFNWTSGLIWQLSGDLTLRGSYATAFRVPAVEQADALLVHNRSFRIVEGPDPAAGGALVPLMVMSGNAPLNPEEAVSWTAGLDYAPAFAPWAKLSFSWFSIEYDGRIGQPLGFNQQPLWLTFESAVAGLTTRNPTLADVQAMLDARIFIPAERYTLPNGTVLVNPTAQDLLNALPGLVLADGSVQNLAVETVEGLDLRFDADFDTDIGRLNFGVNATYTLSHDRKVTATAPAISQLNRVASPPDFRLRGNAGWTKGPWGADLYVNHTPGYDNPFPPPAGVTLVPKLSSWTTLDLTLRFDGRDMAEDSWLRGMGASLGISNLFDTDPPFWSSTGSDGRDFDAANASPVGRFVTLNVTKRW